MSPASGPTPPDEPGSDRSLQRDRFFAIDRRSEHVSLALAHFAFGAAMTTIAVSLLVPTTRYARTLVLVGGGWAMLPDVHQVSPIATDYLSAIHANSPLTDVFWLHRTLDRVDAGDSTATASLLLAAFVAATVVAEYRDYRAPDPVREAYDPYVDADLGSDPEAEESGAPEESGDRSD